MASIPPASTPSPPQSPPPEPPAEHDPYAVLRFRDYRLFTFSRNLAIIGSSMTGVALGWEIYARTGQAILLGAMGLITTLPVILLALPAGHLADRLDRKRIVTWGQFATSIGSLGLAGISAFHLPVSYFYFLLFLVSAVRALSAPARVALLPQLVPEEYFSNAISWNTSSFQVSNMIGPGLGGLAIAAFHQVWPVYLLDAICGIASWAMILAVRPRPIDRRKKEPITLASLGAGIRFVKSTRIILATITLDLFAVLFGGASALLPIFARDILHTGAQGLGWLRAANSAGAMAMALFLAHRPPLQRAGRSMLLAVGTFGIATIIFGLSRWFWLSMLMLFVCGAVDNVSVVVRQTLVQVLTPDEMRGRVSAVNNVFISSSNGLGDFEAGLVARYFGPVVSVVSGGIGTVLVVFAVALLWPEVRRYGALNRRG